MNLYPQLESTVAPLDTNYKYAEILKIEKEFCDQLTDIVSNKNPLDDVQNTRVFPNELITDKKKTKIRSRKDIVKRLKELPTEEGEEEEDQQEAEDEEENSDDDEKVVDEEEDEAGGDYIMSHFDNGEGFEDDDDDGDDITSVI